MGQIGGLGAHVTTMFFQYFLKGKDEATLQAMIELGPFCLYRSFDTSEHAEQRFVILPGHTRQGMGHAVNLQQHLSALFFYHLRHERPVIIVNLLQIGL